MQEIWVRPLGREDPLEKEMATHSSILAWRISWTEEPGRLQSTRSQRVGHDWATSLSLSLRVSNLLLIVIISNHMISELYISNLTILLFNNEKNGNCILPGKKRWRMIMKQKSRICLYLETSEYIFFFSQKKKSYSTLTMCRALRCHFYQQTQWHNLRVYLTKVVFSVQFSLSVVSDSLWPHGQQHARPPCPSPTPRACSNSCSSWWCHPTI